jgi:hypothetical protein
MTGYLSRRGKAASGIRSGLPTVLLERLRSPWRNLLTNLSIIRGSCSSSSLSDRHRLRAAVCTRRHASAGTSGKIGGWVAGHVWKRGLHSLAPVSLAPDGGAVLHNELSPVPPSQLVGKRRRQPDGP